MNRDLLYSLGLALAAWPPLFERPLVLGPEPAPVVRQTTMKPEPLTELEACLERVIPASAKPAAPRGPARCAELLSPGAAPEK
ncbi:MAG: hypothetical protein HY554_00455 [Elusimicrobia bacterium]|nr:hypothetical protein [Elusimicrobiota bacterium]